MNGGDGASVGGASADGGRRGAAARRRGDAVTRRCGGVAKCGAAWERGGEGCHVWMHCVITA